MDEMVRDSNPGTDRKWEGKIRQWGKNWKERIT